MIGVRWGIKVMARVLMGDFLGRRGVGCGGERGLVVGEFDC